MANANAAKIESLKAMFPTVADNVIADILISNGGSESRTVENLLSMTDDSFVPDEAPSAEVLASQSELDESFARALALQDAEHAAQQHQQRQASRQQQSRQQPQQPAFDPNNIPYQPRVRRAHSNQSQQNQQPQQQRDVFYSGAEGQYDAHQQQQQGGNGQQGLDFNKIAEDGKKTFNNFLSSSFVKNVKEKAALVQQQATSALATATASAASATHNANIGASSSSNRPSVFSSNSGNRTYSTKPSTVASEFSTEDWFTAPEDRFVGKPPAAAATTSSSDNTGGIQIIKPSPSEPAAASKAFSSSPGSAAARFSTSPNNTGGPLRGASPPALLSSSPQGKIDFAKLGLLPKREISLLDKSTTPPTSTTTASGLTSATVAAPPSRHVIDDDDEDLEYTRSPFDD